jgi:hypothetical protein
LGILVYSEAIDFIISKGWKKPDKKRTYASDQLAFFTPKLKEMFAGFEDSNIKDIENGLMHAKKYLREEDKELIQKSADVKSIFNKYVK